MRRALLLALVAVLALTLPAEAAATARTSGGQVLRAAPASYALAVGRLADDTRVTVIECTRHARWCLVRPVAGGPEGWMLGSYLVGSAAKNAVTPFEFVEPFWLFPGR